ncbi:hypothetical protein Ciccas_012438, partial [Cichlidogyrus casuarinus]
TILITFLVSDFGTDFPESPIRKASTPSWWVISLCVLVPLVIIVIGVLLLCRFRKEDTLDKGRPRVLPHDPRTGAPIYPQKQRRLFCLGGENQNSLDDPYDPGDEVIEPYTLYSKANYMTSSMLNAGLPKSAPPPSKHNTMIDPFRSHNTTIQAMDLSSGVESALSTTIYQPNRRVNSMESLTKGLIRTQQPQYHQLQQVDPGTMRNISIPTYDVGRACFLQEMPTYREDYSQSTVSSNHEELLQAYRNGKMATMQLPRTEYMRRQQLARSARQAPLPEIPPSDTLPSFPNGGQFSQTLQSRRSAPRPVPTRADDSEDENNYVDNFVVV